MTKQEAIAVAIDAMRYRRVFCEPGAKLYAKYGETLAMPEERRDARAAAKLHAELTEAIKMLEQKT